MSTTTTHAPPLEGLHHLKVAVTDLAAGLTWWERVMGAQRQPHLDHKTREGVTFAHIVLIPGLDIPIEIRRDPKSARGMEGFDPIIFGVATHNDLILWVEHLDRVGAEHSPILRGFIGWLLAVPGPDGIMVRLYTHETHEWDEANADFDPRWVSAPVLD